MTIPWQYGDIGRWVLGLCLIISALLTPEIGLHITGYLADLFLPQVVPGFIGVTWLLVALAGVGLMAGRRWACLLVYVAALYTLIPYVSGFSFFPFVPLLVSWLEIKGMAALVAIHAANMVFVVLVAGVHIWLAKTAQETSAASIEVRRRVSLIAVSLGGLAVLISATAFTIVVLDLRWQVIADAIDMRTISVLLLIIGGPLLILGIPGFVISHRRLSSIRKMQCQTEKSDGRVGGGSSRVSVMSEESSPSDQLHRKGRWYQFTLRSLLLLVTVVSIVVAASVAIWNDISDPSRYSRRFHRMIARADRIVVRDGGFDCCGPVDDEKILFEVISPNEINQVRENIHFVEEHPGGWCMCCGYPGIDWYRGTRRIALTSVQHGDAIRWKGFPGDANLTEASSRWLRGWLIGHGISDEQID